MADAPPFPALPGLADLADWPEYALAHGLSDGLPVYPPTPDRVAALVAASGRPADAVLGAIPPADRIATVETVAANAVMAGVTAEQFPVLLAAVDAVLDDAFNLRGVQTTTHGCAPIVVVAGPCVDRLGFATAESAFGASASHASLAVGRALRLVCWNLGGATPGEPVKEVVGHPGRHGLCVGERDDAAPWPTLAQANGATPGRDAVTVFAGEAPQSVAFWGAHDDWRERLGRVADVMCALGNNNTHTMGQCLVAFTPAEARHLAAAGCTRADVQQTLFALARRRLDVLRPPGLLRPDCSPAHFYDWWPDWVDQTRPDTLVPCVSSPDSVLVIVTGADSIPWAAVCPGWGHLGGFAVTREVQW